MPFRIRKRAESKLFDCQRAATFVLMMDESRRCFSTGNMVSRKRSIENYQRAVFFDRKKKLCGIFLTLMLILYQGMPDRKVWVEHWVGRRDEQGAHNNLFLELMFEKPDKYQR